MDLKYIKDDIVLAVFRKNILELLVLNKDFQLVKTIVVDDSHKDEKELEVAFVEIGEGGF
jgi:predicted RNA-binding protein with PIN domain